MPEIADLRSFPDVQCSTQFAFKSGWSVFVSHRSGETTDDFIAGKSARLIK